MMIRLRTLNYIYILWLAILLWLALHSIAKGEMAMIHAFNKGEFDPRFLARSDVKGHYSGCRQLSNFYCQVWGGASKRPGTYYIAEVADSDNETRVIPFSQSTEKNYTLTFGEQTIEFFLGD